MSHLNRLRAVSVGVACILFVAGCSARPTVRDNTPSPHRTPITGSERADYDRVVTEYIGALASNNTTLAARLYSGPIDFQLSRRSALGPYASSPSAKFTVISVGSEAIIGDSHPAFWAATATVGVEVAGRGDTFKVDVGGSSSPGGILIDGAGVEEPAR